MHGNYAARKAGAFFVPGVTPNNPDEKLPTAVVTPQALPNRAQALQEFRDRTSKR